MIRRERRDGGEGEERGLRKGAERDREKRDKIEEEDKEHTCLWLLFRFLKALSSRLDSAVKRCSIELLSISLLMNPLPDRSNYSPLCHTHYLTPDQYFTSLFGPDPLPSRKLEQKLQNSKGYAESPEFSPVLGLIIFGEKSIATNLR